MIDAKFTGTPGPYSVSRHGNKLPAIVGPQRDLTGKERRDFQAEYETTAAPVIARMAAQLDKTAANAALLAASFDMFVALQAIIDAWDADEIGQLDGLEIDAARAAIAAALDITN